GELKTTGAVSLAGSMISNGGSSSASEISFIAGRWTSRMGLKIGFRCACLAPVARAYCPWWRAVCQDLSGNLPAGYPMVTGNRAYGMLSLPLALSETDDAKNPSGRR